MNLGEIKLESLRSMSANDEALSVEMLDSYRMDERYRDYLDHMPGAINRAMSRFETYKLIPTKTKEIKPSQGQSLKQFIKFDLKTLIADFASLERVMYIYERVVPNIDYQTLSDGVVLIQFSSNYVYKGEANGFPNNPTVGEAYNINGDCKHWTGNGWETIVEEELFCIEYTPVLEEITVTTDNNIELQIPNALAQIIPYFVKADLYEQDEPELAVTARNIFESALNEYMSFGVSKKQRQQYVKNTMW